ncbi:HAMP domain-containing protein [Anaerocolumna sedimenticola]|uniref:HAMP domain-containing protein n=1 Tax=Anaerocolumna sedimenticola TaxID=2696063 RepID=A0A6P1TP91_9FIRM|nr:sensor histidine kinase [Anaerocolumna sedimenticola]QHQ61626.1 HAMP domain-containing protein [Anaerocolumna sedimenticola]
MKKIKFYNALRVKLGMFAIILIAIPVIVIAISYSKTVKKIIQNKYTESETQSVYEAGEKIDFLLDDLEEFSTLIISNSTLLKMLEHQKQYSQDEFNNVLRTFITSRDDIEAIDLILDHKYYSAGVNKIGTAVQISSELAKSTGQPIWLPTTHKLIEILSGKFDKLYFTLGRKVIDFNTLKDYGYLRFDLEEAILQNAYSGLVENGPEEDTEVFICDNRGRIISHPNKIRIGQSIKEEPYANQVMGDKDGHNYVLYKTGTDQIAIYSTIQSNGWKIIKTLSTNYLYQEINQIQTYLILGGVIYVAVILLFMLIFSIRYTEPMMKMMAVIKKVEQGDLTARTEIQSKDEVGQLGISLNNMIGEMQVLIDKLVKEEQEKKEVELEALHAQINPHFLYNTLNTIKWMAKIQGNTSVSKSITALIKLLRISTNLGRDMITLREELDYVENYIIIQKLRFNQAISFSRSIEEECLDLSVPKLILQPIVENSIIYGLTDERQEIDIKISGFISDNRLIIEIQDDGPGIEEEVLNKILSNSTDKNKFSKVGLNNVNHRIRLYCGNEYGINIKTKLGEGTLVQVILSVSKMETAPVP